MRPQTLLTISRQDFRTTFRDPIFKVLLFFPFLAYGIVRWVFPLAVAWFPPLAPYKPVLMMWACMQAATMFGFIYGFLFLEEKEENVADVLRIVPVPVGQVLVSRLMLGFVVSILVNFCLLHYGGIIRLAVWQEWLLAAQFALLAPLMALTLGAFAKSKVEGFAQVKIVNMVLMAPALMYFLPYRLLHLFAVVPTYWSFRSLEAALGGAGFWVYYGLGTGVYLAALAALSRRY